MHSRLDGYGRRPALVCPLASIWPYQTTRVGPLSCSAVHTLGSMARNDPTRRFLAIEQVAQDERGGTTARESNAQGRRASGIQVGGLTGRGQRRRGLHHKGVPEDCRTYHGGRAEGAVPESDD